MSDFFDDENLVETEENSVSAGKDDKKKAKKKKLLPKVISAFVAVAVLVGGIFAVKKFIPEKEDGSTSSSAFETIDVLSLDSDKLSCVTITNDNGTFTFNCDVEKDDESDTETRTWYLEGVSKELQNSSAVSSTITSLTTISAVRKITEKSAELCGLETPKKYAEITKSNNKKVAIYLGDISPDNSGYYLSLSTSEDIYLVESTVASAFDFDKLTFASTDSVPAVDSEGLDNYFEDGTLTTFDSLTVSGANYQPALVVVPNTDKAISEYIPYKITSPEEHYADNLDSIIEFYQSGISVIGAYSYDASSQSLTSLGLDNPDLMISIKLGSKEYINKFKLQSDGNYAVISNHGNLIYKVSADTVSSIANGKSTDFYSSIVCLFSIDELNSFEIDAEGKTYKFGIKQIDDEDSEDKYNITLDGKKIDCSSFQNLYQYILTFGCFDYTTGETDKTDTVNLTFGFANGEPITVAFERFSDTKYQYSISGKPIGKIQSSKIDKLVKYTKKLQNGEKIAELN